MRKTERRLAFAVLPLVALAVALGAYNLCGPFGTSPVVVHVPGLERLGIYGRYYDSLPDFVFVAPDAPAWVLPHETLHYEHPIWTECEVSASLAAQGMYDTYYKTNTCNH